MSTRASDLPPPRRIDATAVAFSGFFLRESSWSRVRGAFTRWACVDASRDDAATTTDSYVDAVLAAIAATPGPHVLLAHSFGGWLAAAVESRMPRPPSYVVLLSALGLSPGLSAAEHAATAGGSAMSALCGLDIETGMVRLTDEPAFRQLLGPCPGRSPAVSPCEPVALLTDALDADVTRNRAAGTRRWYVMARDDALADPAAQRAAAIQHEAQVLTCEGGHLAALGDLTWMEVIE